MKNKITFLFSVAVLGLALTAATFKEDWHPFVSKESGFKILFPQKPEYTPQTIESEIGELTLNLYSYDASSAENDENIIYMVNYTAYPLEMVNSDNMETLDAFFTGAIEGAAKNVDGKILSEKKIMMGNIEGREVQIDYSNGEAIITMRVYLTKNKVYMAQVITETAKANNKSLQKFMNSFVIVN